MQKFRLNEKPNLFSFLTGKPNQGLTQTINFLKDIVRNKVQKKATERLFGNK